MSGARSKRKRRILLVLLTAVGAYAASLGGVRAQDLGADTEIVASCDSNGIDVEFLSAYHGPSGRLRAEQVLALNVSVECDGRPFDLTLFDDDGGRYSVSGTIVLENVADRGAGVGVAGDAEISVSQLTENIDGIAMVIHGFNAPA